MPLLNKQPVTEERALCHGCATYLGFRPNHLATYVEGVCDECNMRKYVTKLLIPFRRKSD